MTENRNVDSRTIFCHDNLEVLRGINSGCVDLIYLDPPFNKNKKFVAPTGSSAEGASFDDIFREEDIKDEWVEDIKEDNAGLYALLMTTKIVGGGRSIYNYCYLVYMAIRLIECHRVLKDTGSLYLHCDPTMSHYLKLLLDCIFNEGNFRNEAVWAYNRFSRRGDCFPSMHDVLLAYGKGKETTFNKLETAPKDSTRYQRGYHVVADGGVKKLLVYDEERAKEAGVDFSKYEKVVKTNARNPVIGDTWTDIPILNPQAKERVGYPTQKPLKLLRRIIEASSNEGDVVLDPFCGCATTCVAAEDLNRQWIGIDISVEAYRLVKERLKEEVKSDLFDPNKDIAFHTDPPARTDMGWDHTPQKWVYVISNDAYADFYKVGIAQDWKARLNSYQTGDPNRAYKVEYKHLTSRFREIEKHVHGRFPSAHE